MIRLRLQLKYCVLALQLGIYNSIDIFQSSHNNNFPEIESNDLCPAGYYCNERDEAISCGRIDFFCPIGSHEPTKVKEGHYTVGPNAMLQVDEKICEPGTYCTGGVRHPCPPGRYGEKYGLVDANCTGACQAGYFCPMGSKTSSLYACGKPSHYCPEGSAEPTLVDGGYFSSGGIGPDKRIRQEIAPKGYYAREGLLFLCPAGNYGSTHGLKDPSCSGICEAGFYCPTGSVSSKQNLCGHENVFCPRGSPTPLNVRRGFYTSKVEEGCRPGTWRDLSAAENSSLSFNVTRIFPCVPCGAGTYKPSSGDSKALCLSCGDHAWSIMGSIACECRYPTNKSYQKKLFFNITTTKCENVIQNHEIPHSDFSTDMHLTRYKEFQCEKGYFCSQGIRYPCPAGSYGDKVRETNAQCSGECEKGHWCGPASKSPRENKCGGQNSFCEKGSASPKNVMKGYYLNEDSPIIEKSSQHICPVGYFCSGGIRRRCSPGRYGASQGLFNHTCDGLCSKGFFCTEGSTSSRQHKCGNITVHCPRGSSIPRITDPGKYSYDSGLSRDKSQLILNATMSAQRLCEEGYFCHGGQKYQCPEGTYGWYPGMKDANECKPCRAGYYCPSYPGPPSKSPKQNPCGGPSLYCPERSARPLIVASGHYSIGGEFEGLDTAENFRTGQKVCPVGHYCQKGKKEKCPLGSFGNRTGLVNGLCSLCPAGHFCEEGSSQPKPCESNTYATPGLWKCIQCGSIPEKGIQRCKTSRNCCSQ